MYTIFVFTFSIRWLTGIDGKPGFSKQSIDHLKNALNEGKNKWQYDRCTLLLDGMKIKKRLDYDHHVSSYTGFVDWGDGFSNDSEEMATEALVIMAVGIQGRWKQPIGRYNIFSILLH